ncbi:MAG TPA: hypothetical protein VFF29_08070, partial [Bacteroidota bacterium]|nr:hypothetical protein [Bacteroidota bacterium]
MKRTILFLVWGFLLSSVAILAQVPNKISYQGLLTTSAGTPVPDGSYDLKFDLFNVTSSGSSLWTETQTGVLLLRGTFSVMLGSITPLDASFNKSLYVEVAAVAGPGISSPITFSPRSELSSSPSSFTLVGPSSIASGNYAIAGGRNNRARGDYSIVGGGGGAAESDSNSATGDYSTVGGGRSNLANLLYATVGGGYDNTSNGNNATISGGYQNAASGISAIVGGGTANTASGGQSTVGGGVFNMASGGQSTVGGGYENTASGGIATVGGGIYNSARGNYSVVSGGGGATMADSNSALGDYSAVNG